MMGVDSYDGNEYEFTVNQIITSLEENPEYHIRKANREFLTNEQSINYLNENATEVILGLISHVMNMDIVFLTIIFISLLAFMVFMCLVG